jgi:hypothetical protein
MDKILCFLFLLIVQVLQAQPIEIKDRAEVTQYGITWSFAAPAKTGKFITGDWWVIGPVTIVRIVPSPGPTKRESLNIKINRWNDTSLKLDTAMRNGSMIVLKAGRTQGYDSRSGSFSKNDVVMLPLNLRPTCLLSRQLAISRFRLIIFAKKLCGTRKKNPRL